MRPARLTFEGVHRHYGRLPVLRGVSGRVENGEVLLVTGGNGSGKSTLLRCLAGLLVPQRGTVAYEEDGRAFDLAERRRQVGWVAPDLALYDDLTVDENLTLFARLRRVAPQPSLALRQRLGLPGGRRAGALSSGMMQRVRWIWALQHSPRLLLLDEPFQNIDRDGERDLRALLDDHLEDGLAVIATPSPLELPRVARRLELDS